MTEHSTAPKTTIELLGKSYQIKCPENEMDALQKAARYLNENVAAMPHESKFLTPEKLAMMVALNFASQIIKIQEQMNQHTLFINQKLNDFHMKLEEALGEGTYITHADKM